MIFIFYLNGLILVDSRSKVVRISPESDTKQLEETIHTIQQRLRTVSSRVHGWNSRKYDDTISKISSHDKIMLDDESSFFRMQNKSVKKLFSRTIQHD